MARSLVGSRGRDVAALLLWSGAAFLALALATYSAAPDEPGANIVGPVGEACARGLVSVVGVVAWALPLEMALLGIPLVRGKPSQATAARLAGDLLIFVLGSALVQVGWPGKTAFGGHAASGAVGELFGELGRSLFSTVGSFLVGFATLGLILIGRASFSFIWFARTLGDWGARSAKGTASAAKSVAEAWRAAQAIELEKQMAERPKIEPPSDAQATVVAEAAAKEEKRKDDGEPDQVEEQDGTPEREPEQLGFLEFGEPEEAPRTRKRVRKKKEPAEPTIVDTSAALEKEAMTPGEIARQKRESRVAKATRPAFQFPNVDLLVPAKIEHGAAIDEERLLKNAEKLVSTLAHYKVEGKVEEIRSGPTVTTYEVSPAPGTKVSKVASLADDLALAMAKKVRIVAPIPGKNRIGFELPNDRRVPVNLRDLIEDRRFQTLDASLPVVLGRDIVGGPVYADLSSMPHVIVAGATGAGKSVGLNVMLTSLLYRRTPEELRLLMIDPKVVELAPFDRIPHMLLPVVTDMKQAATALKWAVDEMERRYQKFADAGTKNIGTYNAWSLRVRAGEVKNPLPRQVVAKDLNGLPEAIRPAEGEVGEAPLPEILPYIVIVIDEFADLMMQQGKEVEACVARLAQKARAAGMHVILATQRPSVDVITGIIKANFPTRIAYRVSQRIDSRTILDEQGAEHLLGRGDMLIKLNGTNDTRRVQCPMVTEEEVHRVTEHLRTQGDPVYDENILKPRDEDGDDSSVDDAEEDPLYDDAVRVVADTRRCSTSWLQRKLGLGYNRAARIVEMMERKGLVGPANGAKDRDVLIGPM